LTFSEVPAAQEKESQDRASNKKDKAQEAKALKKPGKAAHADVELVNIIA
jgi:hypothetical protein